MLSAGAYQSANTRKGETAGVGFFLGKSMESVEKATSVVMQKCNDGLKLIFSNGSDTVYVTMDWVEAAKMTMRLDEQGTEAHTMMQMGLDPYRGDHRQSYAFAGFQARAE